MVKKIFHKLFTITLLLITTALIGCVTTQEYKGASLPRNEVAIVNGIDRYLLLGYKIVKISTVDGMETKWRGNSVEILPGPHTLGINYASGAFIATYTGNRPCYINLNAKPGGEYQVYGEIKNEKWRAWLEDKENGEIINCEFKRPINLNQPPKEVPHHEM